MRTSGGSVGPGGVTLLVVTAVVGVALGAHGWLDGRSGIAPGALGAAASSGRSGSGSSPSPTGSSGSSSAAASPSATSSPGSRAARVGPALRSESFAPYSFLVWPGPPNAAAKTAMTGLTISVRRTGSGISVRAGVNAQPQQPPRFYGGGARVYVVEASLGDEAGNSDYNLGDDAVVVTDARGRIVQ